MDMEGILLIFIIINLIAFLLVWVFLWRLEKQFKGVELGLRGIVAALGRLLEKVE